MAIAASSVAVAFVLLAIPFLVTATRLDDDHRRVIALETKYDYYKGSWTEVNYVKVGDMRPNSARVFLDPFGKTMEGTSTIGPKLKPGMMLNASQWSPRDNVEAFELYMIIRIPELAGGGADDISAYRAYSVISVSDGCISRYWPDPGRLRIEDPCSGDIYRPWDGLAIAGPAAGGISGRGIVSVGNLAALASLDLAVDNEGYIVAKRPDTGYSQEGMRGEGRRLSFEEIRASNQEMLDRASGYLGYQLPFPAAISGRYYLAEIYESPLPYGYEPQGGTGAIEAVYSAYPNVFGSFYADLVITSYPIDGFPELSLAGNTITHDKIDPFSLDPEKEVEKLNRTTISSLVNLDLLDDADETLKTKVVTEGGNFAVVYSPVQADQNTPVRATAIFWTTSGDGREELFVTVIARSANLDELASLLYSLQVDRTATPS